MSNELEHLTPDDKIAILRRHLVDQVPVSTLCDEHQLDPTVFYHMLRQFFEDGAAAFGPSHPLLQRDDDPKAFRPHHENFWTSMVALGIQKARQRPQKLKDLRIWWQEQTEPDGDFDEVVGIPFKLSVMAAFQGCPAVLDLRVDSNKALLLIETKVDAPLEQKQLEVFDYLSQLDDHRPKVYLLMAPPAFGGPRFYPGTLPDFYERGRRAGVKPGFVELPWAVNWASELLGLDTLP